ncbi:SDR family NAD(P)-dependent oxidoreductase, partial [Streptomyces lavendulae]|uniref:SDR family NAD(P)-dependent oxidoreductase n=1 Tax=Streptomyces lavendulae TaxID=1914 RepID=UPI0036761577
MGRFEGYGVLVTGAGRGIGEAVARRLAGEGARVLVTDLDGERAEKAAAGIRERGGAAEASACDVAERAPGGAGGAPAPPRGPARGVCSEWAPVYVVRAGVHPGPGAPVPADTARGPLARRDPYG